MDSCPGLQSWLWSTFAWTYPLASSPLGPSIPVLLSSTLFRSTAENITSEEQKTVQTWNKALVSPCSFTRRVRVMSWNFSFRLCLPFLPQSTPLFHSPKKVALPRSDGCLYHVVWRPRERPHLVLSARALDLFFFFSSAIHSWTRNEFSLNSNYELIHGLSRAFMVFIDKETTWNYYLPKTNRLHVF